MNYSLCSFPAGATDKTDTTWEGKNGVRSIRVSPDGEHLASGDRQGNVRFVKKISKLLSVFLLEGLVNSLFNCSKGFSDICCANLFW